MILLMRLPAISNSEIKSRMVLVTGREGMGSYRLMSIEFQFGMMKKLWRFIVVMVAQQCKYI
jgi:hypothetical protein